MAQFDTETLSDTDLADLLMEFTDTLFYNIKTYDAAQKALEHLAGYLQIQKVTVSRMATEHLPELTKTLYLSAAEPDARSHVEEKTLRSMQGGIGLYRVYRPAAAPPLDMRQRRVLEFLYKTLHTYLNRFASVRTERFAKTHDILYGCLNAYGYNEVLQSMAKKGVTFSEYASIFMNLRKYKDINAKVGFEAGCQVLHCIVAALRKICDEEEYFGRVGGDNFVLLLKKERLLEKLKVLNALPCDISMGGNNYSFILSFKMGVFLIPYGLTDISEIAENASIAYSLARQSHKESVVYYSEEKRVAYEQQKMFESALRPALQQGEIVVYFQPKVDLSTCRIVGAEALCRWIHHGSILPPDSFIPLFEQNGMITEIDFYIFEQTCRHLRQWRDAGLPDVVVSVNFSKISLETPDFAGLLTTIAGRHGISTSQLEIEFTETCCMENETKFGVILSELKAQGFTVSLDDFGKGFSSINMLKNMPFDILKLDRTLLSERESEDARGLIILNSIICMAHFLKIAVIAEGVETQEQIEYLKGMQCEKAQGYYFDKPLPPEEFVTRLTEGGYAS